MSRILIADDDHFLTSICSRAFENAGYEVSTANDGHEAIEHLVKQQPDLILLDLLLPGIDGMGVLKFIRSQPELESLPVFIVSNSTYFSGIVQSAWSEGATKFIRKGEFSPNGLVEEIRRSVPPSAPPSSMTSPDASAAPLATPATSKPDIKSVLIVDDDRTIHGVLCYFLGQAGFQIESAFNGLQALEIARHHKPKVLILDVSMPMMDGFATLTAWKSDPTLAEIPVIMLTASKDEVVQSKAISQGAAHCLTKPFNPKALVDLAEKLIAN